jgi:transposase InsO family protein
VEPTGINQLYRASFTKLSVTNHRMHFVSAVLDCSSRYLLVLRVSSWTTTQDMTTGLDSALREARKVSVLGKGGVITLVTDGGPRVTPSVFSDCISGMPFHHVPCTTRPFRPLGMVKRLIGSLKDEEMNLQEYRDPVEAQLSLERFRCTYNFVRPRQVLRYRVPALVLREVRRFGLSDRSNPPVTTASRPPIVGISEQSVVFSNEIRLSTQGNPKVVVTCDIHRAPIGLVILMILNRTSSA